MNLLLVTLLGACTGLRAMTPIAVLCWFAYRQLLHFSGWRSFTASLIAVGIFTLAALGEYIGDKLPNTPARTAAPGLGARIVFGALGGVLLAQPLQLNLFAAAALGALGGVAGAFGGWFVRTRVVTALKVPDLPVALLEDVIAIGLSITLLHLAAVHSVLFVGNDGTWVK
ncbi:DUF4126 family protein [Terriglobus roseus]|uniref:Uncharacterized membrane protein n=1 Tax=Terriglobus roseus TaxID=392734 RepID=A0A1H4MNZ7_9BACT|nr:DUF4126 family protein [Terriglobus roseus]SEB84235.1 Uncharacterized membrane protein [Terriglobus roseus]